jgi:streptogrisin B
MKRRITKILTMLALMALITFLSIMSYAQESETTYIDAEAQESACQAYDNLMNSFPMSRETGRKIYPDYYGGSFINDEDKLVVYVTNMDNVLALGAVLDSDDVVFQICEYSYNELNTIMDELNAYKLENSEDHISKEFNYYGLFDSENRIIVKLDNFSEENISEFRENVYDSDAIIFEPANGSAVMEVNVNPGGTISDGTGNGSVGFRVKIGDVIGFTTAGHVIGANELLYYGGTEFAQCTISQRSGNVDVAFCVITDNSYSLTNTLEGTSNTLSTTISEPGVGTVINKIGATTNHTSGEITSTNVSINFAGTLITNLTEADYSSDNGDSGGVVYSYISSTNTRYTLGIHTGSGHGKRFYTKANHINAALGSVRY